MASKLGKRVEALEVRSPHNEFSHLSKEELDNEIDAWLKNCEAQDRNWLAKLINDPSELSQELVRLLAMSGRLTDEQCLLARRLDTYRHGASL